MDALAALFKQYDAIRTEGQEPATAAPPAELDNLPWQPAAPAKAPPPAAPAKAPPQPAENWGNVRAAKEERAQKLLEERLHASHANKLLQKRIEMPNGGVTFKEDEKGLDAAYAYRSFPGAAYDENTGTLYIAGSDSWRSWYDDFRNIPAWGNLSDAERYKQAERAYDDLTQKYGKPVHRVVGHSLGGSVALELARNKGVEFSRTFGAPVADLNPFHRGKVERYRHPLDPVSIADRGASWGSLAAYPHSYGGFQHLDHKALALGARRL